MDNGIGCCDPVGVLYYCSGSPPTLKSKTCTSPKVCGWDSTNLYYGCVAAPGGPDPSMMHPEACQ